MPSLFIDGEWVAVRRRHLQPGHQPVRRDGRHRGRRRDATTRSRLRSPRARRAFDTTDWPRRPTGERAALLDRVADLIERDLEELARLETVNTGKAMRESRWDIADVARVFRYYADLADKDAGRLVDAGRPRRAQPDRLRAGRGVRADRAVELPAPPAELEDRPGAGGRQHRGHEAGPGDAADGDPPDPAARGGRRAAGRRQPRPGPGDRVGQALADSPDVDLISLTGGLEAGRALMRGAAVNIKRVALELGGKSPNIVFADADFETAVDNALTAAFTHSGQVCSAGCRAIVQDSDPRPVRRRGRPRAPTGSGSGTAATTPPRPARSSRPTIGRRSRRYVAGAHRRRGPARRRRPPTRRGGAAGRASTTARRSSPTCAATCGSCARRSSGRSSRSSASRPRTRPSSSATTPTYGLAGAVWTADASRAQRVAGRLRARDGLDQRLQPYLPQAEWGGFKQSGIGRELGADAASTSTARPSTSGRTPRPADRLVRRLTTLDRDVHGAGSVRRCRVDRSSQGAISRTTSAPNRPTSGSVEAASAPAPQHDARMSGDDQAASIGRDRTPSMPLPSPAETIAPRQPPHAQSRCRGAARGPRRPAVLRNPYSAGISAWIASRSTPCDRRYRRATT